MDNNYVVDIETISNCFVACFEHFKTDQRRVFVIGVLRNDHAELVKFLAETKGCFHVSYNGIAFDSQILECILRTAGTLPKICAGGEEMAKMIYIKAQEVIDRSDMKEFQEVPEWKLSHRQVDVFKLNHWDNPAKRSSLKWIQYSMDWKNMQEMPINHTAKITTWEQLNMIISYCQNDVSSTKEIMKRSKEQILLRRDLSKEYGINLYSASEPKISRELFSYFLSEKLNIPKYELKQLRTHRQTIKISDIILPYTKFKTEGFNRILETFRGIELDMTTKVKFKYSVNYKGVRTDFGLGGIHGAKESGIYESSKGMTIMSSDVTSYYPNLAIRNKWAPAHLPKQEFCDQYEWFFEERKKIAKKDIKNYVYKIILNSTFGLSIEPNSFLFDPQFGMQITINGQLSLCMLYEMLSEGIPGCIPLMQNTDGLEMLIPNDMRDKYLEICKEWETITQLQLEHDQYSKIVLADVNNYIAISKSGSVKSKGRFEYKDLALHKNKSFLIIPKALHAYFVDGVMPEQYLSQNRNIFDYCAGLKGKGDWKFMETCVVEGQVQRRELQKVIRYYISNTGCKIVKHNISDGRDIKTEAGEWMQTEFNKYVDKPWADYQVNDDYYLEKIYQEIANVKPLATNQLDLFA